MLVVLFLVFYFNTILVLFQNQVMVLFFTVWFLLLVLTSHYKKNVDWKNFYEEKMLWLDTVRFLLMLKMWNLYLVRSNYFKVFCFAKVMNEFHDHMLNFIENNFPLIKNNYQLSVEKHILEKLQSYIWKQLKWYEGVEDVSTDARRLLESYYCTYLK